MIEVTDLNGHSRYLNCDLIETIEVVPETLIVLANGRRHMVRESPEAIVDKVIDFRRRCALAPAVVRREE